MIRLVKALLSIDQAPLEAGVIADNGYPHLDVTVANTKTEAKKQLENDHPNLVSTIFYLKLCALIITVNHKTCKINRQRKTIQRK